MATLACLDVLVCWVLEAAERAHVVVDAESHRGEGNSCVRGSTEASPQTLLALVAQDERIEEADSE